MIVLSHATFEMSSVIHVVFRRWLFDMVGAREIGMFFHQSNGFFKILLDICPEMKDAAGLEYTLDVLDQRFAHYASSSMPLFPPRIREVNMNGDRTFIG